MGFPVAPTSVTVTPILIASCVRDGFTSTAPHDVSVFLCPRCVVLAPVSRTTSVGRAAARTLVGGAAVRAAALTDAASAKRRALRAIARIIVEGSSHARA